MSEMPERIWAWLYTGDFNRGEWVGRKSVTTDVEYIRADLAALSSAAVAEREPVAWRARHSEQENWYMHPSPVGWWECQPLYLAPPPTSELEAENARLRDRVAEMDKALEPFAEIAGEAWADGSGWTNAACQNDRICDWFGPSAFHAARRVREGGKVG